MEPSIHYSQAKQHKTFYTEKLIFHPLSSLYNELSNTDLSLSRELQLFHPNPEQRCSSMLYAALYSMQL